MKTYKPDRSGMYFCAVCISVASALLTFAAIRFSASFPVLMYTAVGTAIFGGLFIILLILPVSFSRASYQLSETSALKLSGFIFEKTQQVAFRNVQYVTLVLTPLCVFTSACFVILHTTGGRLVMWFLSKQDAEEITRLANKAIYRQGEKLNEAT